VDDLTEIKIFLVTQADPGICEREGAVPLVIFLSLSSPLSRLPLFPLEAGPLKPARGSGERFKLAQWGPGRFRAENEFGAL